MKHAQDEMESNLQLPSLRTSYLTISLKLSGHPTSNATWLILPTQRRRKRAARRTCYWEDWPKSRHRPILKEGVYTTDCAGCPTKYWRGMSRCLLRPILFFWIKYCLNQVRGETKRKLKVRAKEHRTETEKVSYGTRYRRGKKRPIIPWRKITWLTGTTLRL